MAISQRSTMIQAGAALALGGIALAAVFYWSHDSGTSDPCKPATQKTEDLTASTFCTALKKANLPALLNIPKEKAAYGGAMAQPAQGGEPSIHVLYTVGKYSVIISNHKPGTVKETEKVAGHSANLIAGTSSGHQLYNLAVSYDAAGTGFYTVDVMMTDNSPMAQDDAGRLERAVAEKVLPTLPEWKS